MLAVFFLMLQYALASPMQKSTVGSAKAFAIKPHRKIPTPISIPAINAALPSPEQSFSSDSIAVRPVFRITPHTPQVPGALSEQATPPMIPDEAVMPTHVAIYRPGFMDIYRIAKVSSTSNLWQPSGYTGNAYPRWEGQLLAKTAVKAADECAGKASSLQVPHAEELVAYVIKKLSGYYCLAFTNEVINGRPIMHDDEWKHQDITVESSFVYYLQTRSVRDIRASPEQMEDTACAGLRQCVIL